MANDEIGNERLTNPNEVSKGKEPAYGKKPIFNGTPVKDFGSEGTHDVDFHKG